MKSVLELLAGFVLWFLSAIGFVVSATASVILCTSIIVLLGLWLLFVCIVKWQERQH